VRDYADAPPAEQKHQRRVSRLIDPARVIAQSRSAV
jgi:hypothetical protein